jgi:UDP-GlcNAc3NAcA epimerase
MKILTVVGTRPQFIKASAVSRAIRAHNQTSHDPTIEEILVHTGQHYDDNLSAVFFRDLELPNPTHNLGVGSASHAIQTARIMERLEPIMLKHMPDWIIVHGDCNSTLASALVASKLNLPIAHVEAGLRRRNRQIPEEINRIVTDRLASVNFCPTQTAVDLLAKEGIVKGVALSGDIRVDVLHFFEKKTKQKPRILKELRLSHRAFGLITLHRSDNTDVPSRIQSILAALERISRTMPLIFPIHPRTQQSLDRLKLRGNGTNFLKIIPPLPFLDMLQLERHARVILTDSGGVQREALHFHVPCITLLEDLVWVEAENLKLNKGAGANTQDILEAFAWAMEGKMPFPPDNPYGNGHAAQRIIQVLVSNRTT